MEGFSIHLKTFLGLAKPNQYSQSARKQISSWFGGDNLGPKSPNLHDPYEGSTKYRDHEGLGILAWNYRSKTSLIFT